ncbi:hypothetical protein BDN70DRAFT_882841 [Pholiota conissans]|uniref:Uncharacterized protein n=1 Tax=Pholiota conissans TaxID=109636 RepID=A0A9P5YUZ9_9AGAR|nr:hypothetical protein BDN70DRAFT_882841 [Pholiota conissans]
MYFKGRDVKTKEGLSSVYGQGLGGGDKAMTSSDVSAAVTSGRPPKHNPEKEVASKAT